MDLDLRNRVAVVAASSQGIGRSVAETFAREGARVVMNGRRVDMLEAAADDIRAATGADVVTVPGDVRDGAVCALLVSTAVDRFGSLDALVTNAGGSPAGTFDDFTDEDWIEAVDLGLLSVVRLLRAALPHLRASSGSAVNISSITVKEPMPVLTLSSSIRPGVVGLYKTLAVRYGQYGVRLNSVAPGSVWTDRQATIAARRAHDAGISVDQLRTEAESHMPLRRYGEPQEVANLVVFLSSVAASYITGTTVLVDGGSFTGLM